MAELHSFIRKIPVNKSHYTRNKAPMRQYMENVLLWMYGKCMPISVKRKENNLLTIICSIRF